MRDPATDDQPPDVLIVGASARAAAWSARRAGLRPVAIDQFGDTDLAQIADTRVAVDYPHDLPRLAASLPGCPWVYSGALENEPRVVEAISRNRPLWGNGPDALAGVRDPHRLAAMLGGVSPALALETRPHDDPPPRDGRWIVRPFGSAAGRGIHVSDTDCPREPTATDLFQRFAEGTPHSALFLAGDGGVDLVGVTRQLVSGFEWRGNVGPIDVPEFTRRTLQQAGDELARTFSLRGLFGVDFVLDDETDEPCPRVTEVNPRYTASVELLEHATGRPLLGEHARCFGADVSLERRSPREGVIVKWIAFAARSFEFRSFLGARQPDDPWTLPTTADRPSPGTTLQPGQPFCTLFARGRDPEVAIDALREIVSSTFVETADGRESLADLVEPVTFDG